MRIKVFERLGHSYLISLGRAGLVSVSVVVSISVDTVVMAGREVVMVKLVVVVSVIVRVIGTIGAVVELAETDDNVELADAEVGRHKQAELIFTAELEQLDRKDGIGTVDVFKKVAQNIEAPEGE